jgi:hypothetical protein
MLLLEDTGEVVFELLPPHITGSRYRNAVAVARGCVLLDVMLHVIVINVIWLVSANEVQLNERGLCLRCAQAGIECWRRVAPYFMLLMMVL